MNLTPAIRFPDAQVFIQGNTAQLKLRLLAQAPVALPRRFAEIFVH